MLLFPLPQAGGGLGWGLFSRAKIASSGSAVAPTLTLPRLAGGDCSEWFERHMRLPRPAKEEGNFSLVEFIGCTIALRRNGWKRPAFGL
jgi:hypothetical protein